MGLARGNIAHPRWVVAPGREALDVVQPVEPARPFPAAFDFIMVVGKIAGHDARQGEREHGG